MKIDSFIAESWRMDGGVAFGVVPRTIWEKQYPADDANLIPMCNRLMLIQTGDHNVLIDTGFGNKRNEKYYRFKYIFESTPVIDSLKGLGFSPEDITDVIFTHLHDDHVGGAVELTGEGQRLVFPNATHWVSRKQFDWAMNPNPREAASYFPDNTDMILNAGKLKLVDHPGEIIPGIEVMLMDGHTGGQMIPVLHTDAGPIVYMADFIPSKVHIPLPYIASVDIQPLLALEEKAEFLKRAVAENYVLFFQHDFYNEACRVEMGEKGVVATESLTLSDLFN